MRTSKQWKKTGNGIYSLYINDEEKGNMQIAFDTAERKAKINLPGNKFTIRRTGFWKTSLEITDAKEQTVAKVYNDKWYASSSILEYNNKKYKLIIRNNPLAEWAIFLGDKEILAYGLTTEHRQAAVKITSTEKMDDDLLDCLLWYLFVPVATENMDDNFTFLLLVA